MTISNGMPLHKRALELLPGIPGRDHQEARYETLAEMLLGATIPADHSVLSQEVRRVSAEVGEAASALSENLFLWIDSERQRVAREVATRDMLMGATPTHLNRDVGEAAGFSGKGRPNVEKAQDAYGNYKHFPYL
jgi:hypothetical protein